MVRRRILMMAVAAGVAWSMTACSSGSSATAADPVSVQLAFEGALSGVMTTADNALQPGSKNPTSDLSSLPAHTQCSAFDEGFGKVFVASITGTVAGKRVRLSIEVNPDNPAYTSPGTPLTPGTTNSGGSTELQLPEDSTPRDDVLGPNGEEPARIVLAADRQSGTIEAWYDEPGYSQKQARGVVHVLGTWRCAHP